MSNAEKPDARTQPPCPLCVMTKAEQPGATFEVGLACGWVAAQQAAMLGVTNSILCVRHETLIATLNAAGEVLMRRAEEATNAG